MTTIGPFSLGTPVASAVAYEINGKPAHPRCIKFPNKWEVLCDPSSNTLVAKTTNIFNREETILNGYSAVQQALDIISANFHENLRIKSHNENYIVIFRDGEKKIIQVNAEINLCVDISVQVERIGTDGKLISTKKKELPQWHHTFRFYRLAESSDDIFDAYRNLFLAFELLLSEFFSPEQGEGEEAWLRRALNAASKEVDLTQFVPNGHRKPSSYIVGTQYTDTRCRLFHAKLSKLDRYKLLLPHEEIAPDLLKKRYIDLAYIWRSLAKTYLGLEGKHGGFSYQGFKILMDGILQDAKCYHSSELAPPDGQDITFNSEKMAAVKFKCNFYESEIEPGIVRLSAYTYPSSQELVNHIGILAPSDQGENLIATACNYNNIIVRDVDKFEFIARISLINRWEPGKNF